MFEPKTAMSQSDAHTVRLTPVKLVALAVAGLLVPFYFVASSSHFRLGQWGEKFWVVGGILWLVGVLAACVVYIAGTQLLKKVKGCQIMKPLNMSIDTDPQQQEAAPPQVLVVRSSSR